MSDAPKIHKIQLSSASQIVEALGHSDPMVRSSVLSGVSKNTAKIAEISARDGSDICLMLMERSRAEKNAYVRKFYQSALMLLSDGSHMPYIKEMFSTESDDDVLSFTGRWLASLPVNERIDFLSPFLLSESHLLKIRIAANLLAHCSELEPQTHLRVAMFSDHDVKLPLPDDKSVNYWLAELCGEYPFRTQKLLLKIDNEPFEAFWGIWRDIPTDILIWLIDNSESANQKFLTDVVQNAEESRLLVSAFKSMNRAKLENINPQLLLKGLENSDSAVRAEVIKLLPADSDWKRILKNESSIECLIACLRQIGRYKISNLIANVAEMMHENNWKIRSASAEALYMMAPDSLPTLLKLKDSNSEETQVAAVKVLTLLGELNG